MRKFILLSVLLLAHSMFSFGQDMMKPVLLEKPATWGTELFFFPLNFAPKIEYGGYEIAAFPKDWAKVDSNMFWTYTFVWNINLNDALTESELENHLQNYFDGLSSDVNKHQDLIPPSASALILEIPSTEGLASYKGKVLIYDSFVTEDQIVLHTRIDHYYCEEQKKSIVHFRFSPKPFEDDVWLELMNIKPVKDVCDQ
ncbi:MAG: hypothetical protein QNK23_13290 [Crocinitomicaceae bacterium]|nr:hypothetical protein [Crocinitomicaceae bacterium]